MVKRVVVGFLPIDRSGSPRRILQSIYGHNDRNPASDDGVAQQGGMTLMPIELYHFIGGKKVPGKSGRLGDVFNPATGELQAKVPLASVDEVNAAVATAKAALGEWAAAPPLRRARVMFKFRELIESHMDELAQIITAEHGK